MLGCGWNKTTTATIAKYFHDRKPQKKNGQHTALPEGQKKFKKSQAEYSGALRQTGITGDRLDRLYAI